MESEEVVFFLFNDDSNEYESLKKIINLSDSRVGGRVNEDETNFNKLMIYLESYVNENNINGITELEVLSQAPNNNTLKKYRTYDIIKANKLFAETGRNGEILIDNYFDILKSQGKIFNYTWYNRDKESGLPYDFTLQENNQNIIHIDVKATMYKFDQPLVFSNQEIDFINNISNYNIYRVFDLSVENTPPKLKICENTKSISTNINPFIYTFKNSLSLLDISLQMAKIAFKPTVLNLEFNKEIVLNFE